MRKLLTAVLALRLAVAPAIAGDVYVVDGARSEAKFEIRYLLSTVVGRLKEISGEINVDPRNPTASSVKFSLKTGSVQTGSADLDQQLRSADFLNVAKFPQITFQSSAIKSTATTNVYQVIGALSLHGVTKVVTLPVEFGGVVKDRGGFERAVFRVRGTLNRKDYGITWSRTLDYGALAVGEDIEITVNLKAAKQAPMRAPE